MTAPTAAEVLAETPAELAIAARWLSVEQCFYRSCRACHMIRRRNRRDRLTAADVLSGIRATREADQTERLRVALLGWGKS